MRLEGFFCAIWHQRKSPRGVEAELMLNGECSFVILLKSSIAVKWWQIISLLLWETLNIINEVPNKFTVQQRELKRKI